MQNQRLYFLDWLRIGAFFLLVLYHTGMYYVTWDWHVKAPHPSDAIEPLMLLSSPWRMCLLFLIGGAAAASLLDTLGGKGLVKERSRRLLVPLIFGMVIIVPPQSYFEVVSDVAYQGSYFDFMQLYLRAYHGFCDHNGCLDLPTWNHLWFLPYLWLYTLLLAAFGSCRVQGLGCWLLRHLQGWKLFVLPVAFLAAGRILLLPHWPHTHNLTEDWHNHAMSLPFFLLGAAMVRRGEFWQRLENVRFAALGFFLAGWSSIIFFYATGDTYKDWLPLVRTIYALCQWSGIVAVCGFGHRHLNFDSAGRRYLTQAVFPVYILHQTLIICLAMALRAASLAPVTEGALIVVLTFAISFGIFEVIRRVPLLQPLFGVGKAAVMAPAAKDGSVQHLA